MEAYAADSSLKGKLRRRYARLVERRPASGQLERPLVSFSFDDAPVSAAEIGAAILERHGVRGSFFISMGLAGREGPMGRNAGAVDIERLIAAGHEIGCHTHSHLDCGRASSVEIAGDVARNRAALTGLDAPKPSTFAYPYGDVSPRAKRVLAPQFRLLRALHHGLVRTGSDLNQAPAVGIEGPHGEQAAWRWLDQAITEKAWLILYTHDVSPEPSQWGCTPVALERLVEGAKSAGAEIVTVAEGCQRISAA
jgi:peptidoglycan/xylan/chitin deacetylase (PgdA/CDA1 family)